MLVFPAPVIFGGAKSSILTKVGAFNTGTGSADIAITGVGFQPKAIIFWWTGRTGTSDSVGRADGKHGIGFASGATERGAVCCFSGDNIPTSRTCRGINNDACVIIHGTYTAVDGKLDLKSMDSDGFTLAVDDSFASNYRVHYMALGGDDIEAKVGDFTVTTSSGNQDFNVGFTPDLVMNLYAYLASFQNLFSASCILGLGAFDSNNQFLYAGYSQYNAANANTESYLRMGDEGFGVGFSGALTVKGSGSIITDGFRLNMMADSRTSNHPGIYLAIKGGNCHIGSTTTRTNTTPFSVTGVGFQPTGVFCISHNKAESAAETMQDNFELSIGAASPPSDRQAAVIIDKDTFTTMVIETAFRSDALYGNLDETTSGLNGRMDLNSFDSDGMTLQMDDADPNAALVAYIAFG